MLSTLQELPRLIRATLRHLFAYGQLAYVESVQLLRVLRRRVLGLAVALIAGLMALITGCLWVIAATWDGPNRLWAVGGLFLGFLLLALIGAAVAAGRALRPFDGLRREWRADLEQIAQLDPSLVGRTEASTTGAHGAGHD